MSYKIRIVNLKPINPDTLVITKSNYGALYDVQLPLDYIPETPWQDIFVEEMRIPRSATFMPKIKVDISSIIVSTPPDQIKEAIEIVKKIVDATNERVKEHNIDVEIEWEKRKKQKAKEEEIIKRMREQLKQ